MPPGQKAVTYQRLGFTGSLVTRYKKTYVTGTIPAEQAAADAALWRTLQPDCYGQPGATPPTAWQYNPRLGHGRG